MFMNDQERISPEEKLKLVSDHSKMRNMIDSVSQFIANVLCLKNQDVSGNVPLVEVCRQEIHHVLWVHGIAHEMDDLARTYRFVCRAEDHAERMRDSALLCGDENIDISVFTTEDSYYFDDQVIKCLNGNVSRVDVGGYGHKIYLDVHRAAMDWLDKLDKVMCLAASIEASDSVTADLVDVKVKLSRAISKRIAVMSYESVLDDELSSRELGLMVEAEFMRCETHASHKIKCDIECLEILRTIATEPTGEASRNLLYECTSMVRHVLKSCPCEILMYTKSMGFEKLSRALLPDMDIEVRVAMAKFWSDNFGDVVRHVVDKCLPLMREWKPDMASTTFSSVHCMGQASPSLAMPPMKFLHSPRRFARREKGGKRTGLDERGERAVRLVRCVWELASQGIIRGGVVASEIVAAIGTEGVVIGRMAAEMINSERDMSRQGVRLSKFFAAIHDQEGEHRKEIAKAACSLSMFSCAELETVFRTDGGVLRLICQELAARTRSKMLVRVDDEYKSFASEALAYALPIIERRRQGLGINRFLRPTPISDLLRTIPKACAWLPTSGTLRLSIDDLRLGHPHTRKVFDEMHDNGVLVTRKGGGKAKTVYHLDSALLCELFSYCVRI